MKTLATAAVLLMPLLAHALQLSAVQGYEFRAPKVTEQAQTSLAVPCAKPSCKLGSAVSGGRLRVEGRIEERTAHHRSGAKLAPLQVAREYEAVVKSLGGEWLNPESGENGAFVYRVPEGKAVNWIVLDNNFAGYYTLIQVTSQPARESTVAVQASELAASLKADGAATLYIEFDTNRAELKADGVAAVDEILKVLAQQPTLKLSVEGHTDNVGDAAGNRKLSEARAQAVVAALTGKGIAVSRLSAKGLGPDVPIADNRKEEGRAKNRRVELVRQP
jgi:OmpA-OmpF porin, OOP family